MLAYMRMTMSCVDCHKLVRGKLVAQVDAGLLAQQSVRRKNQSVESPKRP